ncbi:hypothetical protein [Polynucleobacter sp. UK-Gri1-W3]|uniref:hypothetical protein n=1 Tax=Polynucleobacter sp. UK-Gri1-W3 TaxID=1819737 RepID=UPI001C0D654E|nr:hypothetical protein [Polynucleobacter sp. UK-Gri1-W3]MBU3538663.1 hypothetical protein [Polynucleobacter sp. UK-Gri1-W3]
MKRIVDVFTSGWSPEIVWIYIISIEGDVNPIDLNQDEVDLRAFEYEALRLAAEEGRGDPNNLIAKVRE